MHNDNTHRHRHHGRGIRQAKLYINDFPHADSLWSQVSVERKFFCSSHGSPSAYSPPP